MACYLRNGTKARRALPCNHTAILEGRYTSCCDPNDQCLTNGLCRDPAANELTNYVWFFGCTDPTFKDPSCGTYCDKANKENNHLIFQCPEPDTWCCNTGAAAPVEDRVNRSNTTCCSITDLVFKAPAPVVYTTALYSGTPFPIVTLATRSTLRSSNSTALSTALSTTRSVNTGATEASSTSQSTPPSLAVGVGAGLGGGAAIALAVGWVLWRRRKRENKTPSTELTSNDRAEMTDQNIVETSGKTRFEIQDKDPPAELMGDFSRAELPSPTARR
ncbi:hypothetical protein GQ44DRAFT_19737 [Phaeosphaeriaceae sp. PMI808]|nr:hypothetical protein GQ44DRAFT_19737 [Phaeosphaeriaceae sp. PMI808]